MGVNRWGEVWQVALPAGHSWNIPYCDPIQSRRPVQPKALADIFPGYIYDRTFQAHALGVFSLTGSLKVLIPVPRTSVGGKGT